MDIEDSKIKNITKDESIQLEEKDNDEKEVNYAQIGNQFYDRDTLNRITIVRLTQIGIPQIEIRRP